MTILIDGSFILAISEPPLTMTCSIPLAIRSAIASARGEINQEKWFKFGN